MDHFTEILTTSPAVVNKSLFNTEYANQPIKINVQIVDGPENIPDHTNKKSMIDSDMMDKILLFLST